MQRQPGPRTLWKREVRRPRKPATALFSSEWCRERQDAFESALESSSTNAMPETLAENHAPCPCGLTESLFAATEPPPEFTGTASPCLPEQCDGDEDDLPPGLIAEGIDDEGHDDHANNFADIVLHTDIYSVAEQQGNPEPSALSTSPQKLSPSVHKCATHIGSRKRLASKVYAAPDMVVPDGSSSEFTAAERQLLAAASRRNDEHLKEAFRWDAHMLSKLTSDERSTMTRNMSGTTWSTCFTGIDAPGAAMSDIVSELLEYPECDENTLLSKATVCFMLDAGVVFPVPNVICHRIEEHWSPHTCSQDEG